MPFQALIFPPSATNQVVEGQEQTKEAIEEHTTDVDVQRDISSIQQKLDGIRAEEEQESIQEIEDQTRQARAIVPLSYLAICQRT